MVLTRLITLLAVGVFVNACSHLPPATPDDTAAFVPPPAVEALRPVPPPTVAQSAPQEAPQQAAEPATFSPDLWRQVQSPGAIVGKPERPEHAQKVVAEANAASRVGPSKKGYYGNLATQRYVYQPGKVYEILTSPTSATSIMLPVGEHLAAPAVMNSDDWEVAVMVMGEGDRAQHVVILRPLRGDVEATVPLFTQQGHAFFLHVKATAGVAMVAVQFEISPITHIPSTVPTGGAAASTPTMPAPQVDLGRLHTGYSITPVGAPPWIPAQAYDDGKRTYLRFKESLRFTTAPAIFVMHADKSLGVVEFLSYEVPDHPERGTYYIVQGLWPQLELRGAAGERVRITRQSGQTAPYVEGHK